MPPSTMGNRAGTQAFDSTSSIARRNSSAWLDADNLDARFSSAKKKKENRYNVVQRLNARDESYLMSAAHLGGLGFPRCTTSWGMGASMEESSAMGGGPAFGGLTNFGDSWWGSPNSGPMAGGGAPVGVGGGAMGSSITKGSSSRTNDARMGRIVLKKLMYGGTDFYREIAEVFNRIPPDADQNSSALGGGSFLETNMPRGSSAAAYSTISPVRKTELGTRRTTRAPHSRSSAFAGTLQPALRSALLPPRSSNRISHVLSGVRPPLDQQQESDRFSDFAEPKRATTASLLMLPSSTSTTLDRPFGGSARGETTQLAQLFLPLQNRVIVIERGVFACEVWGSPLRDTCTNFRTDGEVFGLSYVMGTDVERSRYTVLCAEPPGAYAWAIPKYALLRALQKHPELGAVFFHTLIKQNALPRFHDQIVHAERNSSRGGGSGFGSASGGSGGFVGVGGVRVSKRESTLVGTTIIPAGVAVPRLSLTVPPTTNLSGAGTTFAGMMRGGVLGASAASSSTDGRPTSTSKTSSQSVPML